MVEDLAVSYRVRGRERLVLRGVSFHIASGEAFGLVGESGCGKSTAALAVARYLPRQGRISGGRIRIGGRDTAELAAADLRRLRSGGVAMVYQNPGRALNPVMRIGPQIAEVFEVVGVPERDARRRTRAMLAKVQIADPDQVMERYPHQLSGGMQQRVMIAMALAANPALLILDEPTTGLDATVEAEFLDLVRALRREFRTAVLFISHNLGVIGTMCERVGVLYAGVLVEAGPTAEIFAAPAHPYTAGLLRSLPKAGLGRNRARLESIPGLLPAEGAAIPGCVFAPRCPLADERCRQVEPEAVVLPGGRMSRCHYPDRAPALLEAEISAPPHMRPVHRAGRPALSLRHLSKTFRPGGQKLQAVSDVSLDLWPGETLGLVGESGSGKTTLARLILGLAKPDPGGAIALDGTALAIGRRRTAALLKMVQIVFQNPDSALNRALSVRRLIGRALFRLAGLTGRARAERLAQLAAQVRLAERHLAVRPRQLSGGLRQRVAIARAFAGSPRIVVCDEPTSQLDVSVQGAILNLLVDLQAERSVGYIVISHDLAVVRYLADRIGVFYLGRLLEVGPAGRVFAGPHHPYTEALLSAVPGHPSGQRPGGQRIVLTGELPSPIHPPSGCVFHTRCPRKIGVICELEAPALSEPEPEHWIRCHLPLAALGRSDIIAGSGLV
ncbi:MAG: ABC transporter ATP-binding protein [Acetobacteraceae bacterium]